jgi:hypothetical protein
MTTDTLSIFQEAAALRELKTKAAETNALAKQLKSEFEQAEIRLFERMDTEGADSIKTDGILYVPTETVYAQIQDRAAFVEWATDHMPELLETKERKGLLNEFVREMLDTGQELPPGLGFYADQYISQRAG